MIEHEIDHGKKITITGDLGSGKSVVSRFISTSTGFGIYSAGTIQREIAEKYKMTTLELNKYAEDHADIDHEIDSAFERLKYRQESMIIDSRMAWFFIPNSFKVNLIVDINIAAKRIIADQHRKNEPGYTNMNNAVSELRSRKESENKRFLQLYNADCTNLENFDLAVNTSDASPEETANLIVEKFYVWMNKKTVHRYWSPPKILYPTQHTTALKRDHAEEIYNSVKNDNFHADSIVEIVEIDNLYYLRDGHIRTSAAIMNDIVFIPVKMVARDGDEVLQGLTVEQFFSTIFEMKWVYDWEDYHGFTFARHPESRE